MTAAAASRDGPEPHGSFEVSRLLATGGMAEVYLAHRAGADGAEALAAVKRLRPDRARDPDAAAMFRDEARIGALFSHPNIVRVLATGDDAAGPFIAMEFVPGEELSELCRRGIAADRLPGPWEAAEIARQAAAALGHVHEIADDAGPLGIVHGDVSPPNLLVTARGEVVLIDFGVARARITARSDRRSAGKLAYMAPEQAAGGEADARSDVFALGVVLWELAAGARLFRGPADEVRRRLERGEIPRPSRARPGLPAALDRVVMDALATDAARRPSARELEAELGAAAARAGMPSGAEVLARYVETIGASERMRLGETPPAESAPRPVAPAAAKLDARSDTSPAPEARNPAAPGSPLVPWLLVGAGMAGVAVAALLFALWQQ